MSIVSEGLRARWGALDEAVRAMATEAIRAAVLAARQADPWYSPFSSPPRVEVLGASTGADGVVRVHFVADHLNYCSAQSGSDWAEHHLFVGDVELRDGAVSPVRVEHLGSANITERDWDDGYDPAPRFTGARDRRLVELASAV